MILKSIIFTNQKKFYIPGFYSLIIFFTLILMFSSDTKADTPNFSTGYNLRDYKWKTSEDVKEESKEEEEYRRFYASDDRLVLFPTAFTMPEATFSASLYLLFYEDINPILITPQFSYSITNKIQFSTTTLFLNPILKKKSDFLVTGLSLKAQLYQKENNSFAIMPGINFNFSSQYDNNPSVFLPTLHLVYSYQNKNKLLFNAGAICFFNTYKYFYILYPSFGLRLYFLRILYLVIETDYIGILFTNYGLGIQFENFSMEGVLVQILSPKIFQDDDDYSTVVFPFISITYMW